MRYCRLLSHFDNSLCVWSLAAPPHTCMNLRWSFTFQLISNICAASQTVSSQFIDIILTGDSFLINHFWCPVLNPICISIYSFFLPRQASPRISLHAIITLSSTLRLVIGLFFTPLFFFGPKGGGGAKKNLIQKQIYLIIKFLFLLDLSLLSQLEIKWN